MLALAEKQLLIQALGRVVVEEVQSAVAPIIARLDQIEQENTKDFGYVRETLLSNLSECKKMIEQKFAELPKPEKGEKGDPGEPGKDGKDGRDGIDGKNLSLDDVREYLAAAVRTAVADVPVPRNCVGGHVDRAGHLFLRFSDGSDSDLGEVAGKDGRDVDMEVVRSQVAAFLASIEKPKDGVDGLGFDDLQVEFDGARLVTLKFIRGDIVKIYDLLFPVPLDKGVWRPGEYEPADMVQRDGSMWIAEKTTSGVPGLPESGWRLCTKRGRDGKDGKQGPEGQQGKPGRDGRDLTQLGPDGSKWG